MKKSFKQPYIAAGVTAFTVIACGILFFFAIYNWSLIEAFMGALAHILRPIFVGMVIAFLLLPIHRGVLKAMMTVCPKKDKVPALINIVAILVSMLFAFAVIYLFMVMIIPQVYTSIIGIIRAFPGYIESVRVWLLALWEDNPEIQEVIIAVYNSVAPSVQAWLNMDILPNLESMASTLSWMKDALLPNITGVVFNLSAFVVAFLDLIMDLFVSLIVVFYLLVRKDIFAAHSKKIVYSIFPARFGDVIVEETRNAYRILNGFIIGKLLDSLIIGVLALICCNLFKFPYPVLLATIIGVTNIIPFFGPFIGAIPCAVLIFLVSPVQCLYFVIFILALQQFDGNILGPKILGDSTGLASFWVLFSILLFGGLFGFAGMVLGVPVFAMLYSIANRMVRRGLRRHGLPMETEHYIGKTGAMANYQPVAKTDETAE